MTQKVLQGRIVVTLLNIQELKSATQSAELRSYFENLFNTVRHPLVVLDEDLRVVSANRRFCQTFDVRAAEIHGLLFYEVGEHEWDLPELRELLEKLLPASEVLDDFEVEHEFRKLGHKRFQLSARRVQQAANLPGMILLAFEEVTKPES